MMRRDISVHMVGIFGFDGEKVASWRGYFDMKEVEAQVAS